jgi:uncharacterized linocin/CFP29 family protein
VSDFFMRDDAPLSAEEWAQLDGTVVGAARQFLVGRRFIELAGPFGAGTEVIPVGTGAGRKYLQMETIQADFSLTWRDIEANRQLGVPVELGPAAQAAFACAQAEDKMVLDGLSKAAKTKFSLGNWGEPGVALSNIAQATEALVDKGMFGPFAVVLSPALYAQTERVSQHMGRTVGKLIKEVAEGGLYRSPLLKGDQGFVVSQGAFNLDLVVGQDLITAYMGNEELDHLFRVLETIVLRIKRPEAICKLGK